MAGAAGKLAKCYFRLMEYDFDTVYRAIVKHQAADALKRPPTKRTDDFDINDEISVMVVATRAQKRLTKVLDDPPEPIHIETNEPKIAFLVEFCKVTSHRPILRPYSTDPRNTRVVF